MVVWVAGELEVWPSRAEMITLLRAAGLSVEAGAYSIRVTPNIQLADYGSDVSEPRLNADAATPDDMMRDLQPLSGALIAAGVRHRFEVYDDTGSLVGYVHYRWPRAE